MFYCLSFGGRAEKRDTEQNCNKQQIHLILI
jgi:hypothetical protein